MVAFSLAPQGIGLAKNVPFLNLAADPAPYNLPSIHGARAVGKNFPSPILRDQHCSNTTVPSDPKPTL